MFEPTDILGDVRRDGHFHSVKDFIQPDNLIVQEIASILSKSEDPITTAQDFVHKIIKYKEERGEYWRYPTETLITRSGDCDDSAILLLSILRNYLPPEDVYAAVGGHNSGGHAWVMVMENSHIRVIESTASSTKKINENEYNPEVLFNDRYAYALNGHEFGFVLIGRRYHLRVE